MSYNEVASCMRFGKDITDNFFFLSQLDINIEIPFISELDNSISYRVRTI